MKRILYLGYYLKEIDKRKLEKFVKHATQDGRSKIALWSDIIQSSLKYNISILDYFYFRFYEADKEQRETYAGTGFMYEYQLKMNPKASRDILENKIRFIDKYRKFIIREAAPVSVLRQNPEVLQSLLQNPSGRLVVKGSLGQVGAEVKILKAGDFTGESLLKYMEANKFDLLEEYVVQHPAIMAMSPSGLNTIRIFTQIKDGKLHYLGARFRITINSEVDNMAAGNPAAPIDIASGIVDGPAVFSDITRNEITVHPVTGVNIIGFKIPYWEEIKTMMEEAVFLYPENQSVGWDVAISEKGPELIEGNHNWCKLLWQLPAKKGLKGELRQFMQ
ncbi:MAG: hexapeptide transferase [Flavobacterium sp. BFFFF1]|uniref:sugar-transfer associated ATP-grasp domain-containing protein n=1 Tax=Flavobacterium sp. BFFFF1 TaxID=2015557 RepID=UPI000BCF4ED9|nr:sugar-transfer associated ATP-grasp domain-containing protein [Flavobacterium sp. BFFFF1]OYU81510.1 MAG: hexapeptide transferase [Flavobacterium sp. BFFFF1]